MLPTETEQPATQQSEHYFFVMGEVVFVPAKTKEVKIARLNTFITCPEPKVNAKSVGRAQTGLQIQLHKKLSKVVSEPPEVTDVIVHAFSYMGEFTKEQFMEGVQDHTTETEELPPTQQ